MWDSFLGLCDLGAHVRIPNIFKMTSEMLSVLVMTTAEETPLGVLDESPLTDNSSQHQATNDKVNQLPSSADPFSISKNRINGDIRPNLGSSALFEKLNGSRVAITPIGGAGGPELEGLETPSVPGGSISNVISFGQDAGGAITALPMSTEPPLAPTRKARTLQGLGMDTSSDAPPKMRSNSIKSKSRSKGDSEEGDSSIFGRAAAINIAVGAKRTVSGQVAQAISQHSTANASSNPTDPMAPQRRSVRLFNQIRPTSGKFASSTNSIGTKEGRDIKKAKATSTKSRSANGFNVGRVVSGNRNHGDSMDVDNKPSRTTSNTLNGPPANSKPVLDERAKELEGLQWLLELFAKLGSGYFALCHYQCQEAIQIYNSVPSSQRETPWVLSQIARAYYEQASYSEAEKVFVSIKRIAPSRLEDMEVYSTILWHLKSEVDLAFLSHELNDLDRNSPQAWCALGNSNSLARKHDAALKCFKRATQLDPKFAYAFTLQGHEHVANEEYDKALYAYRAAVAADHRHYNAWYGLGKVFEKQGKYSFAEQHYRTAANINPTNAVLVCCIGVVLEKMKNPKAALLQYTRSCELAPKSSLSRFKKARVLMALHEPEAALVELKVLKDIAPDEANVHFLLGRVYKTLRQKGMAIKHFTTALNLDPKVSFAPANTLNICSWMDADWDAGKPLYQGSDGANGRR